MRAPEASHVSENFLKVLSPVGQIRNPENLVNPMLAAHCQNIYIPYTRNIIQDHFVLYIHFIRKARSSDLALFLFNRRKLLLR